MSDAAVSRETGERLGALSSLVRRWNPRINLVSPSDLARLEGRHVADSLQLLPLIPPGDAALLDLGSGGGFPGLVLACALTRPVHLVEADRRKAAFLVTAAAELGLANVTVHPARIEAVSLAGVPSVLTARGLAPLLRLLRYAAGFLAEGGVAIFPKGRGAEAELTEAAQSWTFDLERWSSRTDPDACILRLSRIRASRL